MSLSFYLASLIGSAKIKIVFTEEAFLHIWEKKFLFSFEKNIKIAWDTMDNYVLERHRIFDCFTINLTTNQRYKINRLAFLSPKDDFVEFLLNFPNLANSYLANSHQNQNIPEKETKNIECGARLHIEKEIKAFKWLVYAVVIIFVPLFVHSIISPNEKISWFPLVMIAAILIPYVYFKNRIKKTNQ